MVKIDVEKYIGELRNLSSGKQLDMYSLKKELNSLSESKAFENFEKGVSSIDRDALGQIKDFSILIRMKSLASGICSKKRINDRLHTMHFSLSMLKSGSMKEALDAFLYSKSKITNVVSELNDFKSKLDEIEKCHSMMLPRGLDSRLHAEKYNAHVESLRSVHKMQKNAFVSAVKLFIKMAKENIKSQKSFK